MILQDLHKDILAHEPAYQDILTKSKELSEKAAGPDKQELDEKMTDLSRRWDGIMGKVSKRLAVLEEVVTSSVQYAEALEQLKVSLESMEEKAKVIKNVSSDLEVINKQDDTAKVPQFPPVDL